MKISFIQLCWYNLIIAHIYFVNAESPTIIVGFLFLCMGLICLIKAINEENG